MVESLTILAEESAIILETVTPETVKTVFMKEVMHVIGKWVNMGLWQLLLMF